MSTLANGQQLPDSSGHGLTGLGAGSRMGALGIGDRRQHAHQNENKSSEQRINEQAFPFMQFQCGHGGDEPESSLCERSSVFTPAGSKHRKHARSRQSGCQKQRQIAPEWAGGARSRAQIFFFFSSSPLPIPAL